MKRTTRVLAGAVVLVALIATGGVVARSIATQANQAAQESPANTAKVEKGKLENMVSQDGTLTYRARSDGSPYAVINRAGGTYTELPNDSDKIDCGAVLYRVDNNPVLLLCGSTPAYRSLWSGERGPDVAELNANLVQLGYAARAQLDPSSDYFSFQTASALEKLQSKLGESQTGSMGLGQAVFLPESVRIAQVTAQIGGSAGPGEHVLDATSGTLEVRVALGSLQQGEVKMGDAARIILPSNVSVTGKVERIGRVAQLPAGQNNSAGDATIAAYISLDNPDKASGLDQAPVHVEITTEGVENVLSVPVTAIVGKSGGGFAVEVVRAGGRRELVVVELGLFDTADGRVEVTGNLHEGDQVVVPSL
jgi:hypothetical protein